MYQFTVFYGKLTAQFTANRLAEAPAARLKARLVQTLVPTFSGQQKSCSASFFARVDVHTGCAIVLSRRMYVF